VNVSSSALMVGLCASASVRVSERVRERSIISAVQAQSVRGKRSAETHQAAEVRSSFHEYVPLLPSVLMMVSATA
jgi:hypothetical protein